MNRLAVRFDALKAEGRAGLVTYVMAGDPDFDTSLAIVQALPAAGADVIELGFAFSDPMADGPSIQKAVMRALAAGMTLSRTLELAARFRADDARTPVVLMGYANPIEQMGSPAFAERCAAAGVDGVIVVDLPPEEDAALREALAGAQISLIRLATPTTDERRLDAVLAGASGFVYYVSVAGVTGGRSADADALATAVARLRRASPLPVAVGFGVREADTAAAVARIADAVVVGSALVDLAGEERSGGREAVVSAVSAKVRTLSVAVRGARREETQAP